MIPFAFVAPKNSNTPYPLTLPSLRAWIDPSQPATVTASMGKISQVNDLSGNGEHAVQATGALQPQYVANVQNGLHAMLFSLTTFLELMNSLPNTPTCSVGGIIKTPAAFNQTEYLFEVNGNDAMNVYIVGNGTLPPYPAGQVQADAGQNNIATVISTFNLSVNTWYRIIMVWDSTQVVSADRLKLYINGVDVTNAVSPNGFGNVVGTSNIFIGYPNGNNSIESYYGELVSTNAAMSQAQVTALDNYWTSKWAI